MTGGDYIMDANSWATKPTPTVHDKASGAGKFDTGFLSDKDEEGCAKPKHAPGTFPVAGESTGPFAKPTHAPGTLIPSK